MTRRLLPALAAAGLLLAPADASAQDDERRLYVSVSGMWVSVQDADVKSPSVPAGVEASFDGGWGVAAAVGYRLRPAVRLEGELSYRANDLDELSGGGLAMPVDGDLTAMSGMLNGYLDVFPEATVHPYLGVGLGVARLTADSAGLGADDESDTVFAYQGMLGLSGRIGPTLTLFGGYRYFATGDPTFDGVESEYRTHNVEVGLRVGF